MTVRAGRMFAGAILACAFLSPAAALEKTVRYHSPPALSAARAGGICATFKHNEDRRARVLRFVCTRKLLYVCNRDTAHLSTDPEAAAKCYTERARNYD